MPTSLLGYPLKDPLFSSSRTLVYRSAQTDGAQADPHQTVILKLIRDARPPRARVRSLKREFELLRRLDAIDGVPKALELGFEGSHWGMVQEDVRGQSLMAMLDSRPFRVAEFLTLAERLAGILAQVHAADVIHKDINPSNIVFNRGTGAVLLIDFGIATELPRETIGFDSVTAMEGTLPYISPEQTGRMNRSLDYRTDLYSLGATFFHMLTGHPPFQTPDPLALVHAHIARTPPAVADLAAHVPLPVSAIIAKLLAKAPEDRYQSAEGLRIDLQTCLRQKREGATNALFDLDRQHIPTHLTLSETLYGRADETARLTGIFERVADGAAELVLVSGPSGVGKTALVEELYRPITERGGLFIAGKFDQLQRDLPYAVVIQVLRDLTRLILAAPQARVDQWKAELVEAVGRNGQVLLDVVPEMVLVIGEQPPAPALASSEARTRLGIIVSRVFQIFARERHPLTVFLDDLQWADPASLALIEGLLADGDVRHLLVIGAYRDTEVAAGHPLLLATNRLRARGQAVSTITLAPLSEAHIAQFVADTTGRSLAEVGPLARLIVSKTAGNPYFAREFFKALYVAKLLYLQGSAWTWDHDAIRARGITDNVVTLITGRLKALAPDTQRLLQVAGALGNRFDVQTLAVADDQGVAQTWKALWPAVEGGFLIVLSDAYELLGVDLEDDEAEVIIPVRFAHDQVQRAAYALAPEADRALGDWRIGRRLLARWSPQSAPQRFFDVIGHLNAGRSAATSVQATDELAELNLQAARQARASAAFGSAYDYARIGIELLGPDAEERRHDLAMPLLTECVEAAYQTAAYAEMDRWFDRAVRASRGIMDVAWVHEIKTEAYNAQGRPLDALAHALDFLEALGVDCPRSPGHDEVVAEMAAAQALLAGRSPDDLAAAPDIEDPAIRVAVGLICKVYSSAYVASPFVFAVLSLRQFQLVVEHGNCAVSALSYAVYGLLMAGLANDVSAAYAFGALSNRMLARPDIRRFEAQALHLFNCHTRMWREHLAECAEGERQAWRIGLETGEMEFGSYGGHVASKYALFHGHELGSLRAEMEQYAKGMQRYRQDIALNSHLPWLQAVVNLTESVAQPHRVAGDVLDARAARPALEAAKDRMSISNALTAELLLCTIFEEFEAAVDAGTDGTAYLDAVLSQFNQPLHMFLDAFARLSWWHSAPAADRAALLAVADAARQTLAGWAEVAPVNLAGKVALLEAERLVIAGDTSAARDRYDDAIDLCHTHGFVLDEALALEAAARFYRRAGRAGPARHYLADAHAAYLSWGADTKAAAMEGRYPTLKPSAVAQTVGEHTIGLTRTTGPSSGSLDGALDVTALLRAAEAISSEVVLSELLRRLLTTVMQNAGAAHAVVVLIDNGAARIEAESTADGAIDVLLSRPVFNARGTSDSLPASIYYYAMRSGHFVVSDDASRDSRFDQDPYVMAHQTRSALCVPIKTQGRTKGALYLENSSVAGAFTPARAELVAHLAGQIAVSIDNALLYAHLEERVALRTQQLEARNSFIREVFGRYMSDDVVDTLLASNTALQIGGERREVTLMFTDLRGFTAMCERLTPEQTVRTLNRHLSVMTPIIHRHGGTINYIAGDGLLVLFGAPLWQADHMDRAVTCAIEMQMAMPALNAGNLTEDLEPLSMGIGVHTGEVVVGNIGSHLRAKYTVIGRHANIASRVETSAAGDEVYISEATRYASSLPLKLAGERRIHPKGIEEPLSIFRVIGVEGRDLHLPDAAGTRAPVSPPRRVSILQVRGKEISQESSMGDLVALGSRSVELVLEDAPQPGSDLALRSSEGLVYAKVVTTGETVVAVLTGGDATKL